MTAKNSTKKSKKKESQSEKVPTLPKSEWNFINVAVFAFYIFLSFLVFQIINYYNPNPIVDELFHLKQGEKICQHDFSNVSERNLQILHKFIGL